MARKKKDGRYLNTKIKSSLMDKLERIMAKAVIHVGKRKHTYQINYTMGFYVCRLYFRGMNTDDPESEIARYILPVRPGRADRRKMIIKKGAVDKSSYFMNQNKIIVLVFDARTKATMCIASDKDRI